MIDLLLFQAIFLGIIEGLTEFIPVSSTGHLILLIDIMGFKAPPGKTFEIIIQLGAILAVCWLYRAKIISSVVGTLSNDKTEQKFALNIVLAFLPAAVLGVMFHGFIKSVLFSPYVVCTSLIIGGVIILIVENFIKPQPKINDLDEISWKKALCIGFAQSLAMIPGTSRSGATIIGSILMGVNRKTATEFSFFLAIPTMLGATVYDIYKNYEYLSVDSASIIAAGFIAAFVAALFVVKTVINFISNHGFTPFAYYRIALGVVMLVLLNLNDL